MREREREREREWKHFSCEKICIECERECHIYSNRKEIRIVKIKGRGRDR